MRLSQNLPQACAQPFRPVCLQALSLQCGVCRPGSGNEWYTTLDAELIKISYIRRLSDGAPRQTLICWRAHLQISDGYPTVIPTFFGNKLSPIRQTYASMSDPSDMRSISVRYPSDIRRISVGYSSDICRISVGYESDICRFSVRYIRRIWTIVANLCSDTATSPISTPWGSISPDHPSPNHYSWEFLQNIRA